jgi:hypothetical protein
VLAVGWLSLVAAAITAERTARRAEAVEREYVHA